MRKTIVAIFVATALAVVLAPAVSAAPDVIKMQACHVNGANDAVDIPFVGTVVFGKMVNSSVAAMSAHWGHGDSAEFLPLEGRIGQLILEILKKLGLPLPNANCLFFR